MNWIPRIRTSFGRTSNQILQFNFKAIWKGKRLRILGIKSDNQKKNEKAPKRQHRDQRDAGSDKRASKDEEKGRKKDEKVYHE